MRKYLAPILIVLAVGGAVGLGAVLSNSSPEQNITLQGSEITDADHRLGNPDATVELVEYGDLQCPACAAVHPWVKQLLSAHGDKVDFAFRHYPLKSIHRNAVRGGEAVEAAGLQGKFFEMSDILFTRQSEWASLPDPGAKFADYARELGLNEDQFQADYHSDAVSEKVESGYQTALSLGLNSTPSFFLNGTKITTPNTYGAFESLVLSAQAETGAGTAPDAEVTQ